MNVLVDTSVWSLALRRRQPSAGPEEDELVELIRDGRIVMLGPIRQEILSGIKSEAAYRNVRERLRPFPDHALEQEDFEQAADCFNRCRRKGVQGSNTDFLICAVGLRNKFPIFTTDADFEGYARVLGIRLHRVRRKRSP